LSRSRLSRFEYIEWFKFERYWAQKSEKSGYDWGKETLFWSFYRQKIIRFDRRIQRRINEWGSLLARGDGR
jgi:hypothetical protein